MARAAKFTRDDILDAAVRAYAEAGAGATIATVAALAGAPVGSVYHRFGSRDELFVGAWLRSIRRFHVDLLRTLEEPDPRRAAIASAVLIPRYCRDHPLDGLMMTAYRQTELLADGPAALREDVRHLNDAAFAELEALCRRLYPGGGEFHRALLVTACQESPYGLVRRYLRTGTPIPDWLDEVVAAGTAAILELGDGAAADRR